MSRLDTVIDDLSGGTAKEARPGKVASPEGTTPRPNPQVNPEYGQPMSMDVDALFGNTQAYLKVKKETFQHRLLLWYKLQAFNNRECAKLLGYTEAWVSQITKQPWFQAAFVELAKEQGKDAIQTYLEGEVLPALERTAQLARNGESDAVRLAANRELLDRFLGKSVAKTEIKSDGKLDVTVFDAAKLQEEFLRNQEILKGRGIGAN